MDALAHRKGSAKLALTAKDGSPLAHRTVRIDQVGHRFLFGCGAFDALMLGFLKGEARAACQDRVDKWLALFNYGTLPFYWGRYEPVEGQTGERDMMEAVRMLRARGVALKGHPLCWHTVCAPWLMDYSNEEILAKQLARIRRDVAAFRGLIDRWDVINEVVIMPVFDKYDNAVTRICRQLGRTELVREVFAAAAETNPDATLLINDFNTSPAYERLLEELLEAGVPIGAIGIQSHQHQGYWGLEKLQDVLARFSRFGLPIHFTENTLISGELMPPHIVDLNDWQVESWPTTPEGEERQAREVREMYTELFRYPSVEAVTAWDFRDGSWLRAPSGLIREDGSVKPAYNTLMELIHGTWETHLTAETDAEGCLRLEGFLGDYELRTDDAGAAFTLEREGTISLTL